MFENINKNRTYLAISFILIFIFATSFFSSPLWDDNIFIFKNPQIIKNLNPFIFFNPFSNDHRAWPLGYTIFWLLYRCFGTHWILYKALNIFIHILNVKLFLNFLQRQRISSPLIISLIFAVHPFHVETVSWIFQLNTLLATTTLLLCLYYWDIFEINLSKKKYFQSLLLFTASILIKSYAIFFPFYLLFTSQVKRKTRTLYLIPYFIFSLIVGLNTLRGINSSPIEKLLQRYYIESANITEVPQTLQAVPLQNIPEDKKATPQAIQQVQATPLPRHQQYQTELSEEVKKHTLPTMNQVIQQQDLNYSHLDTKWIKASLDKYVISSSNFYFYLCNFIVPSRRYFFPPPLEYNKLRTISALFLFTLFLGITSLLAFEKKLSSYSKNKKTFLFLLCTFIPISGFFYIPFMKYSYVSDHWAYMLSMPLSIIIVRVLQALFEKMKFQHSEKILKLIFISVIFAFIYQTISYGYRFNNQEVLFKKNIEANPNNIFLYRYLSNIYERNGENEKAKLILDQALLIAPYNYGLVKQRESLEK